MIIIFPPNTVVTTTTGITIGNTINNSDTEGVLYIC